MKEVWDDENQEWDEEDDSLKKLNFSALKELIGKKKTEVSFVSSQPEADGFLEEPQQEPEEEIPIEYPELLAEQRKPAALTEPFYRRVLPTIRDESSVNVDAKITGTIESRSDVNIYGTMKGNVTTEADMIVNGTLIGDVRCRGLYMDGGRIQGKAICTGDVVLENGAMILGDLSCQGLSSNGRIRGDIRADGLVSLRESAVCFGNISADHISMLDGAVLNGQVEIRSMMKEEELFPAVSRRIETSDMKKESETEKPQLFEL